MSSDPSYGLLCAVRRGDVNMVKSMIDQYGLAYSKAWSNGYNLLREAAEKRQTGVAKILLTYGCKVNSKNKRPTETPLHFAVKNNDLEMVNMFLEKHANINVKDHSGEAPLHCAVHEGNTEIVKSLLENRAYVDIKSSQGLTALHLAAESGNDEIGELLLKHGAHINATCSATWKLGYTPLHYASSIGQEKFVKLLLRHGANVNATTRDKFTALHVATKMIRERIVKLLLEHGGSDINARDKNGKTVLDFAIDKGNLIMIKQILELCPELNKKNNRNCLHNALYGPNDDKCHKIVEMLLKHGFSVYPGDANNSNLLHAAVEKGHEKIIEDLLKYGADVNAENPGKKGYTLLHNAAEKRHLEIAKLLLKNDADVDAKTSTEALPLSYAIENIDVDMVKLFLEHGADIKYRFDLVHDALRKESIKIAEMILEHEPEIDINARDKLGRTALHHALHVNSLDIPQKADAIHMERYFLSRRQFPLLCDIGNNAEAKYDTTKLCLSRGADVNAQSKHGICPLYAAVYGGHPKVVELLLDNNADVNTVTDYQMRTALHCSATNGCETISKMLLDKGANVDYKGIDGRTALHVACDRQHKGVITTLLEYGADIDARDDDSLTPLQISVTLGSLDIVQILLDNFADVESRDNCGKTALHIAAKHSWPAIVELLLDRGSDVNATCKNGRTPLYYATLGITSIYDDRCEDGLYVFDQHADYDFDNDDFFDYYNYRNDWGDDDSDPDYDPDHDYSDIFDEDCSFNTNCPSDEVAEIIEQHIVKIRALNLYVSDENIDMVDFYDEHKDFHDECKDEIAEMKNAKIDETNVSYHDLLIKGVNQLALYARNEIIIETLELKEYRAMFPIYSNLISNKFRRGQKRESLLNSSLKALNFLSGFLLPELSSLELLSHLSNKDLENLIKSAPDSDDSEMIA